MVPAFLIPETAEVSNGHGSAVAVESGMLQLTLGIHRVVEQESLEVAIWGSADGEDWGKAPIAQFPQKFYCGTYSILLDLTRSPHVRWIRAQWKMNRWGRGSLKPLFGFYLFAQPAKALTLTAAG